MSKSCAGCWSLMMSPGVPWCPNEGIFLTNLPNWWWESQTKVEQPIWKKWFLKCQLLFLQTKNTFHLVIKSGDTSNLGKTSFFFLFFFRWDPNIQWEFFTLMVEKKYCTIVYYLKGERTRCSRLQESILFILWISNKANKAALQGSPGFSLNSKYCTEVVVGGKYW